MSDQEYSDRLAKALGEVLYFRLNEPILSTKFEEFMDPKPALLAATDEGRAKLNRSLKDLATALGAPPDSAIALGDDRNNIKYDEYGVATIDEMINYFTRCRSSVVRAHLALITRHAVDDKPELINIEAHQIPPLRELMKDLFWEEAEIAYIRLAAYWDRVGQLLDFMYFNVRQYDREGFPAVMDKIQANFYPIYPQLRTSDSYKRLRIFQQVESDDGLKWLLRRRNLLVHSLRLRRLHDDNTNAIFQFAFNHLEEKYRAKLQPKDPAQENTIVHAHLAKCAELLPDVIKLATTAIELKLHAFVHFPHNRG